MNEDKLPLYREALRQLAVENPKWRGVYDAYKRGDTAFREKYIAHVEKHAANRYSTAVAIVNKASLLRLIK